MDTSIQYGNEIINLSKTKTRIIKPEYMKSSILDVGWEEAIEREAEELGKNTGAQLFEVKARLNAQYGYQIKAIQNAKSAMVSFEDTLKQNQKLKDLMYELKEMGLQKNRATKVVKKAISRTDDKLDSLMTEIEANLRNTRDLITTKGFITMENKSVAFLLNEGTTRIDPEKSMDFCRKIITQLRSNNVVNSKQFIDNQKIAEFANKRGLKLEDAKQKMEQEEVERYNFEQDKLQIIDRILKMEVPEDIKKQFSKEQIEKFEKQRRHDRDTLALLREKNNQIATLKRSISRQKDILERIQKGEFPL